MGQVPQHTQAVATGLGLLPALPRWFWWNLRTSEPGSVLVAASNMRNIWCQALAWDNSTGHTLRAVQLGAAAGYQARSCGEHTKLQLESTTSNKAGVTGEHSSMHTLRHTLSMSKVNGRRIVLNPAETDHAA